jgi:hypothetical protein
MVLISYPIIITILLLLMDYLLVTIYLTLVFKKLYHLKEVNIKG